MSDKQLKNKAIKIQGKDYVLVADRIMYFNEAYPDGGITTSLLTDPLSDIIVVRATITPNYATPNRRFQGMSQAVKGAGFINKTAALENAETSAVGRALAMMGIGVIDSVASADEVNKAQGTDSKMTAAKQKLYTAFKQAGITESMDMMANIQQALGKDVVESVSDAEKVIKHLNETGD